ncbi:Imm10 family immunity protein [Nonomuraea sp. NPDC049480]|uniref:Imm10 family immunity protein n=1 Tax=Nonomuraea sp. NPDC049480 TaxID=3364353 RepID=UPI00379279CE
MTSDRVHELCMEIGRAVKGGAPDNWQHVQVHRCQLGTFSTTEISYEMADGVRRTQHIEGFDDLFHQLKAAAYKPGEGTWFVCQLDYSPHGKSYNSMLHTFAVEWPFAQDVEVPASAYVEELIMFPRRPDLTPPWMTAAWPEGVPFPEAGSPPPLSAGADEESDRTWPPLRDMVVRAVGRDDDSETITFGMAEYEDGTGNALIFMMSAEEPDQQEIGLGMDTYCIVREDQSGTTYGGVTHCDLAYGRLTLHFTEKAAQELGVELVLRLDLQVDDDSIELLKNSLREILLSGRHDQRPHSVHL